MYDKQQLYTCVIIFSFQYLRSYIGRPGIGPQLYYFQKGVRLLGHYSFPFTTGRPGDWATITLQNIIKIRLLTYLGKWLENIFGIPFLSPEEVGNCIAMDFTSEMPQNNKLITTFSILTFIYHFPSTYFYVLQKK